MNIANLTDNHYLLLSGYELAPRGSVVVPNTLWTSSSLLRERVRGLVATASATVTDITEAINLTAGIDEEDPAPGATGPTGPAGAAGAAGAAGSTGATGPAGASRVLWPAIASCVPPNMAWGSSAANGTVAGGRVVIPKTGTITAMAVCCLSVGTSTAYRVGIYTPGPTDPRTVVYGSGSLSNPSTGSWQDCGVNPGVAVTIGNQYDFVLTSNGTAQWASTTASAGGVGRFPTGWDATIGSTGKILHIALPGAYQAFASVAESAVFSSSQQAIVVLALIT